MLIPPEPVTSLQQYLDAGGGQGVARARQLGADQTIQEVNLARLRGRGGAGFPTGRKWASVRSAPGTVRYAVVNAAEGEPGTFKDRTLLRTNPYQVLEGLAIAALAVGAEAAWVATKRSYTREAEALGRAVDEMGAAGLLGVPVTVVLGPDEYLYGEEKALLEVIEGNAPLPRLFPPYQHGLFATDIRVGWEPETDGRASGQANPTLVNNVETLANVPHILARGAEWFRSIGTPDSPGTAVCTVVGDVVHAGVAEVEMGTPLREVIERVGGGPRPGRTIKAVLSGVSNPVITDCDVPLEFDTMPLGSAGFIVYDDSACMVEVARLMSQFLYVESCGQCPPCKLGTEAITEHLTNVELGSGTDLDIETIGARLRNVTDANRCALGAEEQAVVSSILRAFADEFVEHLEGRGCPRPRPLVMPKLLDLDNGVAVFDERYRFKQPDWTYATGAS